MSVKIDLTGEQYGKLTVLDIAVDIPGKKKKWLCRCECGNEVVVAGSNLRNGHTTGCKDCAIKKLHKVKIKHDMSKSKLYQVWNGMLNRCENKNTKAYIDYGGRGISVCSEWHDSATFFEWALQNGYEEGKQIDRIDNDGNYEPNNCRWVSRQENANNKRNNRRFYYDGKLMTMAEIARANNINYKLFHKHLSKGMSVEEAIRRQKRE